MRLIKNSVHLEASTYRLLVALIFSLLLHLALITKLGPSSQNHGASQQPLQVRLVAKTPPNKIMAPTDQSLAAEKSQLEPPSSTKQPASKIVESKKEVLPPSEPKPLPVTLSNNRPQQAQIEIPRQVEQQAEMPVPDQNSPASWVEIEFDIFSGADKKLISAGLLHYESSNEYYELSFKEKMNISEMNSSNFWQSIITGRITKRGLSPISYERQGKLPKQLMTLENLPFEIDSSNESQSGRMPDGILDRQSLLLQFMFFPPNDNNQLMLTDGIKAEAFTYQIQEMAAIDVKKIGAINTVHLVIYGGKDTNTTELWLAPDFKYLPVKGRYINSNGDIIELIARSLTMK